MSKQNSSGRKFLARNKKAFHDYHILEKWEAGIVLKGTEVKSLRQGKANLKDSYATISKEEEVFITNMHISPYEKGNRFNHSPMRKRKLLLHKKEIYKLKQAISEKGLTVVPLSAYLKNGKVKIEISLVKGKRQYDKRESLKEKSINRDIAGIEKGRTKIKGF